MSKVERSFDKLFQEYDKVRAKAKEAKSEQDELNAEIKERLEAKNLDSVDATEYICTYKFEKDKEEQVFDEEKFAEKDPKKYKQYVELMKEMQLITKKYTKTKKTPGARKLIITAKNAQEE